MPFSSLNILLITSKTQTEPSFVIEKTLTDIFHVCRLWSSRILFFENSSYINMLNIPRRCYPMEVLEKVNVLAKKSSIKTFITQYSV